MCDPDVPNTNSSNHVVRPAEQPALSAPNADEDASAPDGGSSEEHESAGPVGGRPGKSAAAEPSSFLWLHRADQVFVGTLVILILVLMGVYWVRLSRWGTQPVEIDRLESNEYHYQVEINSATWIEWMQLDGIGPTLARRIVDDREKNGPFSDIDDVQRVKGIGPKTLQRIRPWLTVGPERQSIPNARDREKLRRQTP